MQVKVSEEKKSPEGLRLYKEERKFQRATGKKKIHLNKSIMKHFNKLNMGKAGFVSFDHTSALQVEKVRTTRHGE